MAFVFSWPLLLDTSASQQILLPMQIMVEIHYLTRFRELWGPGESLKKWKSAAHMVGLQERFLKMGYVVAHRDDNQVCWHCTELTLVRARCPGSGVYERQARTVAATE